MGNFGGHALPGSFFIIFALWWTIQTFRGYYKSLSNGGKKYVSTVASPCCCCPARVREWPWEAFVLLFFTGVGFTLEIITGFKHGRFAHIGNGQHATMFFFFALCGVVQIVVKYWRAAPRGLDYATMVLAFGVEALLFRVHIMGRPPLDILLHTLLVYTVYACCLACLLEMMYPGKPLARLVRAFFTFVQGTWFWQVAFVLYPPSPDAVPWKQDDHDQMMVVTMMFAWHMAVVLIIMLFIGGVIGACFYCTGRLDATKLYKRVNHNGLLHDVEMQSKEEEESEHSDTSL